MKVEVSECSDPRSVIALFESHQDDPFTHQANTELLKTFSQLEFCRIVEAKANGITVGCVYTMKYTNHCGWLGGVLVHREFRRKGIGTMLLNEASRCFDLPYSYAFVAPKNIAARKLFEKVSFKAVYRRLNYGIQASTTESHRTNESAGNELQWDKLTEAVGFKERGGIINLGFYPVKLTRGFFEDLKRKGRVVRFGDVIEVVANSCLVDLGRYTFLFNDHILNRLSLPRRNEIAEINPFYTKQDTHDLAAMLKRMAHREVILRTYVGDPVASKLPLKGSPAALVLEKTSMTRS